MPGGPKEFSIAHLEKELGVKLDASTFDITGVKETLTKYHDRKADIHSRRQMVLDANYTNDCKKRVATAQSADRKWTHETCFEGA